MEKYMELMCFVMMQQKMASCKKEAMDVSKERALLRAKNYRVKAAVSIKKVCKTFKAVLDIGTYPDLLKADWRPQASARHVVSMKPTLLRSAVDIQVKVKKVIGPEVQMRQRIAETDFLVVTDLDTDVTLKAAYTT